MWTDDDVDLLLDEWMNGRAAPRALMDRLPDPGREFFDRCNVRAAERRARDSA